MSKRFLASILSCVSCVLLLSVPAWAGIINGDFEQPLNSGWTIPAGADGVAEIVPGYGTNATSVAHLKAAGDFTYTVDGGWDGSPSQAVIQQMLQVDPGKTTLSFDAVYSCSGLDIGNATVTYTAFGGGGGTVEVPASSAWATYQLPLLDGNDQPLAAGTWVFVNVTAEVDGPYSEGNEGNQVTQVAEGYFDNFRLDVPEPCSLLLVLAGLPLIRRR